MRIAFAFFALFISIGAVETNPAALAARQWRQQHERAIIDDFVGLLSIPNVSSDRPNIRRNAEAVSKILERRGIASL